MAGGILLCPVHPCMRPCVRPEILLTIYLAQCLTHFRKTYVNDALWDRDERFAIWGQSSRSWWNNICWNRHCTGGGIQYSTSCVELDFLVLCSVLSFYASATVRWCWRYYVFTSCKYPSSGRSSTPACGASPHYWSCNSTAFRNRLLGVASAVVRT